MANTSFIHRQTGVTSAVVVFQMCSIWKHRYSTADLQSLSIRTNASGTIRPKQPDGIEPLVEILPEAPRTSVFGGANLCAQPKRPEKRNVFFSFRDEAAIGQPHKEIENRRRV